MRRSKSSFLLFFFFWRCCFCLFRGFGGVAVLIIEFWGADEALIVVSIVRRAISRSRRRISTGCRRREGRDRSTL